MSMLCNELVFIPETHQYRIGDMVLPSVTQLMQPLSQAKYGTIDAEVMEKAAKRGTAAHEAIEFYAEYGIRDCPAEAEVYLDAFVGWYHQAKPQVVATEQPTYHRELLYAGTVDLQARVDGKLTLIDYKTTAAINDMLTRVQLEAYDRALASQGIQVEEKAILHLRKDGSYRYKSYPKRDMEAWQTFCALLTMRAYINKYNGGH